MQSYYISVTDESEHLIPSHESPHGSPPLDCQPLSCEGEFKLLYITLRAETAGKGKQIWNQNSKHRQTIITNLLHTDNQFDFKTIYFKK